MKETEISRKTHLSLHSPIMTHLLGKRPPSHSFLSHQCHTPNLLLSWTTLRPFYTLRLSRPWHSTLHQKGSSHLFTRSPSLRQKHRSAKAYPLSLSPSLPLSFFLSRSLFVCNSMLRGGEETKKGGFCKLLKGEHKRRPDITGHMSAAGSWFIISALQARRIQHIDCLCVELNS